MKKTLILGIGNLLMGDEGIGIYVVRYLEKNIDIKGVDFLDGGTGGFNLLEFFQIYDRVILIDATKDDHLPGTVSMIKPKFSSDYPKTLTAHEIGLKDLLDSLFILNLQPEIVLFTVSIKKLEKVTLNLSPEIEESISKTAEAVIDFLNT